MDTVRYQHRHLDVVCELDSAAAGDRAEEWMRLRGRALSAEAIGRGARLWLRKDEWATAEDLARREAGCCGFLDVELVDEGERLRLDVTSEAPGAAALIACLVGTESECPCSCC